MNSTGFCSRCGTALNPGARFCVQCGFDISGQVAAPAATAKMATPPPTVDPWLELQQRLVRATVGEYDIQGEIGRGGMASVYLAHDIALDRKVAIKVMSPDLFRDAAMADRFKREARTAASLSHPQIIHIYAVKQQADILFFVMELIRGRPLDVLLRESGPMPLPMAQYLLAQIGGALGYAHRRGIVHRDVKPANVMVDEEGKAIVTDFGIAKVSEAKGLTMTGATIGTPAYMSPEQCNAREVTGASDQYSLGCMAFEMLAGKTPFQADSLMGVMYKHFNEPPPPLAEFRPDLPPAVIAAVSRMLGKKAEDRFPRIEDAVHALGNVNLGHEDPHLLQLIKWVEADPQRSRFASHTPKSPVPAGRPSAATTPVPPSSSSAPPAPPVATVATGVATLVIDPAQAELHPGESAVLRAYPRDAKGSTLTGKRVTWSSSAPAVATIDGSGKVSAATEGSATITAVCEGHEAVAEVTVRPTPVTGIVISPSGGKVVTGESLKLVASVQASGGASLVGRRVQWSSSAPNVASIDLQGTVTGLAPGKATITAASDQVTATVEVVILPHPVSAVRLDDPLGGRPLAVGQSVRLRAVPTDSAGHPLADRELVWKSASPAILEVSDEGVATAVAPGRAKLSVMCEGVRTSLDIVVSVPADVAAEPTQKVRGSTMPSAARRPNTPAKRRSKMPLIIGGVIAVALLGGGVVFLKGRGAQVPGTETNAPAAAAPVAPADTKVASVYLIPGSTSLAVGETLSTRLVARNAADSQLAIQGNVRWTSSDPSIASVSASGVVKVLKGGRVTVTADYAGQTAIAAVTGTVTRAVVARVTTQVPTAALWIGDTLTLLADAKDAGGASLGGRRAAWQSSDPNVVRVGNDGRLTALAAGRATLTATVEGVKGTGVVNVVAVPFGRVVVDPTDLKLTVGQTRTMTARVQDPRGRPMTRTVVWRSSAPAILSVTSAGLVKAEGAGNASIFAETDGGRAEVKGSVAAVVVAAPSPAAPPVSQPAAQQQAASAPSTTPATAATTPASNNPPATNPATTPTTTAAAPANFAAEVVELGGNRSCALRGGELWCWGAGSGPAPTKVGRRFDQVSIGVNHGCGVSDAQLFCWGGNSKGQIGNNSTTAAGVVEIGAGTGWKSVSAGETHTCAVSFAGRVFCWGDNRNGQLGDGTTSDHRVPTPIAGTGSTLFSSVAVGKGHSCAIAANGRAWCWGDGFAGQLGTGQTQVAPDPTEVTARTAFTKLVAGDSHTCGLTAGGQVWCWGEGRFGQLGSGSTDDRPAPVQVRGGQSFTDVAAGGVHTCGVTGAGQLYCWGGNSAGQLGDGSKSNRSAPVAVTTSGPVRSVSTGATHTCATGANGVECWGEGRQGQLGDGSAVARSAPGPVPRS